MNKDSFFTVVHKLTVPSILTFLLCCSSIRGSEYGRSFDIDGDYDDRTRAYEALDTANSPSKAQLSTMETEAKLVMGTILSILENGKCYKALTDDIDENPTTLEMWVKRTKESQEKIGLLLKAHPNIYCISLRLYNFPVKEEQMHVRKNFKQNNIMWIVPPNSNRCLLIVFPSGSCMSLYGATTLSKKENVTVVATRNIPSHFIIHVRKGEYPNFLEETREDENRKNILETIIDSHSMISEPSVPI